MPNQVEASAAKLRRLILEGGALEAEALTRQMGAKASVVLLELEEAPRAEVRRQVLELAMIVNGGEECRLFLRRLGDPDPEVKVLAAAQVSRCGRPELLPDLEKAAKTVPPSAVGALALAIGQAGAAVDLPVLRLLQLKASGEEARHDVELAQARLGDPAARAGLVSRLRAVGASTRVAALNDCLYLADSAWVRDFGAALADETAVTALSVPENPPVKHARVADVAVFTMIRLGVRLSFEMPYLDRLAGSQLDEARRWVEQAASR
jgi:hypothetical protein